MYDDNRDGYLDKAEMATLIKNIFRKSSSSKLKEKARYKTSNHINLNDTLDEYAQVFSINIE